MHRARVAEAHLDLCRMHIHVHQLRLDLEEERVCGLARVMQHVGIGLADRMGDHLVAHEAAVHEQILGGASAGRGRQRDPSGESEYAGLLRHRQRMSGERIAEHRAHSRRGILSRQGPARPPIVLEREMHVRPRQCDAQERFLAMTVLGRAGAQELAPGWGVEVEISHLGRGAGRARGRRRRTDVGRRTPRSATHGDPRRVCSLREDATPMRCLPAPHRESRSSPRVPDRRDSRSCSSRDARPRAANPPGRCLRRRRRREAAWRHPRKAPPRCAPRRRRDCSPAVPSRRMPGARPLRRRRSG